MPRYIDADALRDRFHNLAYDDWNQGAETTWANAFSEAADIVGDAPTADVVEVKHGNWITSKMPVTGAIENKCSECGTPFYMAFNLQMNFCPNCGADMRNGDNEL